MEPWRRLDLAGRDQARDLLRICCGASRWSDRMVRRRPFGSLEGLLESAREEWFALDARDWREAFSHHPKIGDSEALRLRFGQTRHLSEREQEGVGSAPDQVLTSLADLNRLYEEKFGYIFIVCATGRSAAEMLEL